MDRSLPNSKELEKALIGACLIGGEETVRKIQPLIGNGKALYTNAYRLVFDAILKVIEDGVSVDQVTVTNMLQRIGKLEEAGGALSVTEPMKEIATTTNAPYHAQLVADDYHRRQFIFSQNKLIDSAYSGANIEEVYAQSSALSFEFNGEDESVLMADLIDEVVKETEYAFDPPGAKVGVPTGLSFADSVLGGWQPGEFITIAARPSAGKTALAVWTSRHAGVPVYFVSAEMPRRMLGFRMLAGEVGIPSHRLRSGDYQESEKINISRAQQTLSMLPIFVEDRIDDVDLVIAECYRMKREANANRERQVAKISKSLKRLAKDTDVPVIALCQLSRAIEYSGKRRPPQKSDLRDSGALEQDLDVIIFLHPVPDTEITEFIIDKNRNGPKGMRRIRFAERTGAFHDLETMHNEIRTQIPHQSQ
mgnify:CR=1 FL=1